MEKKLKKEHLAPKLEVIDVKAELGFTVSQLEKLEEISGEW